MQLVLGVRLGLGIGIPVAVGLEGGFGDGEGIEVRFGLLFGLAGFPETLNGVVGMGGNQPEAADHRLALIVFLPLLVVGESSGGDFGGDSIRVGGEQTVDSGLDFGSNSVHGLMQF